MRENSLRWFGHVRWRPSNATVKRLEKWQRVEKVRGRRRPKRTWMKVVESDTII